MYKLAAPCLMEYGNITHVRDSYGQSIDYWYGYGIGVQRQCAGAPQWL